MNKEEIEQVEEIKKLLNFTTEGTSLRINNEVSKLLLKYIQQLELNVEALEMEHEHDVAMIDEVKSNAVKWSKERDNLKAILDKVTDKLKEDAREEEGYIKWLDERSKKIVQPRKTIVIKSDYARSILNIIEGEKK